MHTILFRKLNKDLQNFFSKKNITYYETFNNSELFYFIMNEMNNQDVRVFFEDDCDEALADVLNSKEDEIFDPAFLLDGKFTLHELCTKSSHIYHSILNETKWNLHELYFKNTKKHLSDPDSLDKYSESLKLLHTTYLPLSPIPATSSEMLYNLFRTYIILLDQHSIMVP